MTIIGYIGIGYVAINILGWTLYGMILHLFIPSIDVLGLFVESNGKSLVRWIYSCTAVALCGWYICAESGRGLYMFKKLKNEIIK